MRQHVAQQIDFTRADKGGGIYPQRGGESPDWNTFKQAVNRASVELFNGIQLLGGKTGLLWMMNARQIESAHHLNQRLAVEQGEIIQVHTGNQRPVHVAIRDRVKLARRSCNVTEGSHRRIFIDRNADIPGV
ncbi:hypothetical protein SDC9_160165 [bioreactor metagenome]|uniref:Uncharacterized protein n=1 Tax=bioreactor metagenome TaxID=1076179 RepID=A0A645FEM4_9ZZZZ